MKITEWMTGKIIYDDENKAAIQPLYWFMARVKIN